MFSHARACVCMAYFMRQLVKRIVKCSVSLDAHGHDCIVSKAKVNVIRRIVSVECVRIARNERTKNMVILLKWNTLSTARWNFTVKLMGQVKKPFHYVGVLLTISLLF